MPHTCAHTCIYPGPEALLELHSGCTRGELVKRTTVLITFKQERLDNS